MKSIKWILGILLLLMGISGGALADQALNLPKVQLISAIPDGWTLVTPETAEKHAALLGVSPEIAALYMESENWVAVAFGPGRDARINIRVMQDDETALYFDIERYTTDMRRDIRAFYLDTTVWKLTGYRFTEAEWKNKSSIGRYLRLTFNRRVEEEIVARGLMALTVRNGRQYILEIVVEGRRLTTEETRQFEALVNATQYMPQLEAPLLPVGLNMTTAAPQEVNSFSFTLKGATQSGALVQALIQAGDEEPILIGEVAAKSSGNFTLPVELPEEGAWQLILRAELEGFAPSQRTSPLTCRLDWIPVNQTVPLAGEIWDAQPLLAGSTLAGATLTLLEGDTEVTRKTNDGSFSFKLDPLAEGQRRVALLIEKDGYTERMLVYNFNRRWHTADLEAYLKTLVQRLSYENLIADPAKYAGRMVKYTGMVTDVSEGGGRAYVRLAITQKKDGSWQDEIIFLTTPDTLLGVDDLVHCYGTVTGESHLIPLPDTEDEEGRTINLPSLTLQLSVPQ